MKDKISNGPKHISIFLKLIVDSWYRQNLIVKKMSEQQICNARTLLLKKISLRGIKKQKERIDVKN